METHKLNDVIHLYIGQQVEYNFITRTGNVERRRGEMNAISNYGTIHTMCVQTKNYFDMTAKVDGAKLILRRLDSMTEDEMLECGNMDYDFSSEPELNKWEWHQFETLLTPAQFLYLLSRGFWLFGEEAFEEGIIIDKESLK